MKHINKIYLFFCYFSSISFISVIQSAARDLEAAQSINPATHSLLIILDDKETTIQAASSAFLAAFIQAASPIIASTHLLKNITSPTKRMPSNDPKYLAYLTLGLKSNRSLSDKEKNIELKNIYLSSIDVPNLAKDNWIIKKINESLCLLLPITYLTEKQIEIDAVTPFLPDAPLTKTEFSCGLRVNHMETIEDITTIREPEQAVSSADYFIPYLGDKIFIQRQEYHNTPIPAFSIYIMGHGHINSLIVGLPIPAFREFLSFLQHINTRLLIYTSCYAAGTNAQEIYKDYSNTAKTLTFNFPIITTATTDAIAPTAGLVMTPKGLKTAANFNRFVQEITNPDSLDLVKAWNYLRIKHTNAIAQIKYPGLEWFSVLDPATTVTLGRTMTKSRRAPLDIATFYAKRGKPANPIAILLYTENIPFEIIVDTKNEGRCYAPTFISMTPGTGKTRIKKISSTCNSINSLLGSFFLEGFIGRKTFIIEEMEALFTENAKRTLGDTSTKDGNRLYNIVITLNKDNMYVYFKRNGNTYYVSVDKNRMHPPSPATDEQRTIHFARYSSVRTTDDSMERLKEALKRGIYNTDKRTRNR